MYAGDEFYDDNITSGLVPEDCEPAVWDAATRTWRYRGAQYTNLTDIPEENPS